RESARTAIEYTRNLRIEIVEHVGARNEKPQAAERKRLRCRRCPRALCKTSREHRIDQSAVRDVLRKRADRVERRGERHQTVARHAARRRFESYDSGEGRGKAARSARVGAD